MDRRQAEIGGKDYLVFLYVYYTPLYPFALRPSHQDLVQGWNSEVLFKLTHQQQGQRGDGNVGKVMPIPCVATLLALELSPSLSCKVSRGRGVLYLDYNAPAQILN